MGKTQSKLEPTAELDNRRGPPSQQQINAWIQTGNVVPCESAGPLVPKSYHCNLSGLFMGFHSREVYEAWFEENRSALAEYETWSDVDFQITSAEWAMTFGHYSMGSVFPYYRMKGSLTKERNTAFERYKEATQKLADAEPEAYASLTDESSKYVSQGIGQRTEQGVENITELYSKALLALPDLWNIALMIATAGGSSDICWSVKKLLRLQKKVVEKGYGHPAAVSDVIRVSIFFPDLGSLRKGLDAALDGSGEPECKNFDIVAVKNRFMNGPILEQSRTGYNDFLLKMRVSGHIGEIQCHVSPLYEVYGDSGPNLSRWFNRLLQRDDVFEGERNEAGKFHGKGKMTFASGDIYEGDWANGEMNGQGTMTFAGIDGGSYVGEWHDGKFAGKGVLHFASGNRFEGEFKDGKEHGHGTLHYARGKRQKFEGEWENGNRSGFGVMTYANGESEEGEYTDGALDVQQHGTERSCAIS